MCLAACALFQSERFPFVLASNRDEFFDRATAPMQWWPDTQPAILAGRDLDAGGTWLGVSDTGRLALLTNIRNPREHRFDAASRGSLVPAWLGGDASFAAFWAEHNAARFNGFNLLAFDFNQEAGHWYASSQHAMPQALSPSLYGLSNAELDTPWPKLSALKNAMRQALIDALHAEDLIDRLFKALGDTRVASDDQLPSTGVSTGVSMDVERALSAAHVNLFDGTYGTRCATVLICEQQHNRLNTTVLERSFHPGVSCPTQTRFTLPDWPGTTLSRQAHS